MRKLINNHIKLSQILLTLAALALLCGAAWASWSDDDEDLLLLLRRDTGATGDVMLWDASGDKVLWDASNDKVLWQ